MRPAMEKRPRRASPMATAPRLLLPVLAFLLLLVHSAAALPAPTTTTTLPPHRALPAEVHDTVCDDLGDCSACFKPGTCGWCATTGKCLSKANAGACANGFSDAVCQTTCPKDAAPLHEAAGVIQLGGEAPRAVYYLPTTCTYTIWPLPEASGPAAGAPSASRRTLLIRLQFEYINLARGDTIDIYQNGLDGPKILSIANKGEGVVNRIITTRSDSVVIRLNAEGMEPTGGTGFRLYYRVIESSPLDAYLLAAIVVTSILTCLLCSCCCNNCVTMIAGHPGGRGGRLGTAAGSGAASHRALSAEEKARIPVAPYDPADTSMYDVKECCICLSDFERGTDLVKTLPCGHFYHLECLDPWLGVKSVCPLCKADVRDKLSELPPLAGEARGPWASWATAMRQRVLQAVRHGGAPGGVPPDGGMRAAHLPWFGSWGLAGGGVGRGVVTIDPMPRGQRPTLGDEDGVLHSPPRGMIAVSPSMMVPRRGDVELGRTFSWPRVGQQGAEEESKDEPAHVLSLAQ